MSAIAARHLSSGETIVRQEAIWIGPGATPAPQQDAETYHQPICLGCYCFVFGHYKCRRCQWPLCGSKCMEEPWHKEFECKILTEHKIPFEGTHMVYEYYRISILRILLLSEHKPEVFAKIKRTVDKRRVEIEYKGEQFRMARIARTFEKKFFFKPGVVEPWFLGSICRMILVDGIHLNLPSNRCCTALYDGIFEVGFSCVPNSRFNHYPACKGKGFTIELYALEDIPKGAKLVRTLDENLLLLGTFQRRKALREGFEIHCMCKRCSDATELGTFFSAIKCRDKECNEAGGLLLPLHPLSNNIYAKWKCTKCNYRATQKQISESAEGCIEEIVCKTRVTPRNLAVRSAMANLVEGSEAILAQCVNAVHENHYSLWPLRNALIGMIGGSLLSLSPIPRIEYAMKMLDQANVMIRVLNAIMPGYSPIKAKAYYTMAKAVSIEVVPELRETVNTITVREVLKRSALTPLMKLQHATPPLGFGDVTTMLKDLHRWVGKLESATVSTPGSGGGSNQVDVGRELSQPGPSASGSSQCARTYTGMANDYCQLADINSGNINAFEGNSKASVGNIKVSGGNSQVVEETYGSVAACYSGSGRGPTQGGKAGKESSNPANGIEVIYASVPERLSKKPKKRVSVPGSRKAYKNYMGRYY